MAVKSGNTEIIYQAILTVLADATNDLSRSCQEQRPGTTTEQQQVKEYVDYKSVAPETKKILTKDLSANFVMSK